MISCEFCEISHNTFFLKNPSDGCFCINTRPVYFPTTTFRLFKNDVTNIFRLNIFFAQIVDWKQEWAQFFKPLARRWWWWWWIVFVVWLTDERCLRLISSRDHCQRFSLSQISNTPRAGFEPAQNLNSDFVQWSCPVVITTTPWRHEA